MNCSTFQLGKKTSLFGACWSQVVSIPTARQDTALPVRVNTESHAKHLSFWLGCSSRYSRWKGRDFTETERLFSSGLETTWPFNHIWKPVFLKAAHFVGRMCSRKPLSAGSLQSHSGICYAGIQPTCGSSASLKFVLKTRARDDWRSSWTYPKSVFKHKLREKHATKKQSRFAFSNCTSGPSLLRALSIFYHQETGTGFVLGCLWFFFKEAVHKVIKEVSKSFSKLHTEQRQSSFGRNSPIY